MPQADLYLQEAWGFYRETSADYSSIGGGRGSWSSPTSGGGGGDGKSTVFRPVALIGTFNQFSARWQELMHDVKTTLRERVKESHSRRSGSPQLKAGSRATDGFKSLRIYRYLGRDSPNGLPWCHESIYANAAGGFGRYSVSFKAATTIDEAEGIMTDVALALLGSSYFGEFQKDIAGISILLEGGTAERGCVQMIVKHSAPNPEFQSLFAHAANAPPRACGFSLISKALLKNAEPLTPGQSRRNRMIAAAGSDSAKDKSLTKSDSLARANDSTTSKDLRRSLELPCSEEPCTPNTEETAGSSTTFGDSLCTTPPVRSRDADAVSSKPPKSPPPAQLPPQSPAAEKKKAEKERKKATTTTATSSAGTPKGENLEAAPASTAASPPPKKPLGDGEEKSKRAMLPSESLTTTTTAGGDSTSSDSNSPEKGNVWAKKKKQQEVRDLFRVASTLKDDCTAAAKTLKASLASIAHSRKKHGDNFVPPVYPENNEDGIFARCRRDAVFPVKDHSAVSAAGLLLFEEVKSNSFKSFGEQWAAFQTEHGISSATIGSATEASTLENPEVGSRLLFDLIDKWRFERNMCDYVCWEISRSEQLTECQASEGVPRGAIALEERHHRESLVKLVQGGLDELEAERQEVEQQVARDRVSEEKKEQAKKKALEEADAKAKRDAAALQTQKRKEADAKVAEEERQRKKQEKLEKKHGVKQSLENSERPTTSEEPNRASTPSPEGTSSASPSVTPTRGGETGISKTQHRSATTGSKGSSSTGSKSPVAANKKKKSGKNEKDEDGMTKADLERQQFFLKILIFGCTSGLFIAMVFAALYI